MDTALKDKLLGQGTVDMSDNTEFVKQFNELQLCMDRIKAERDRMNGIELSLRRAMQGCSEAIVSDESMLQWKYSAPREVNAYNRGASMSLKKVNRNPQTY